MRVAVLFFSLAVFIFGAEYTTSVSSLYQEGDSKVIGRLLPTVEVKVLGKVQDKTKVEFEGYIQEGSPNAIYFAPNRRILVAGMVKTTKFDYKVLETLKDDGKTWNKISVSLLSDETEFTNDINGLYQKAQKMYSDNCSICHVLHNTKEFNANQWPSMVNSMLSRTAISKDESYLLIQYLQKNASNMPWHKQ
ncbi:hypothetical protein CCY99_08630 [Helicobacter sp. 16-1353]|uniref:hypothetical protein n=1 Tax=Helicobacter sp. 16-1353 TaxID=2004996 RepID=UPI000DCB1857|nr:hypothetical protein [Helicobacter sp. 16-1353]RAX51727.1 hypothetical protein CCY99_08630 [Helicobacter sp. 16-1353]